MKPGASAKLEICAQGRTKEINVTVGELKDAKVAAESSGAKPTGRSASRCVR